MEGKEASENADLKFNFQKTKIMVSDHGKHWVNNENNERL